LPESFPTPSGPELPVAQSGGGQLRQDGASVVHWSTNWAPVFRRIASANT